MIVLNPWDYVKNHATLCCGRVQSHHRDISVDPRHVNGTEIVVVIINHDVID